MQAAGGEGTAAGTAPFPPPHTPGVAPRGGDLPRSDIGGLGTCGTPGWGGGHTGLGDVLGVKGGPNAPSPQGPAAPTPALGAPTFGPQEGDGGRGHARGGGRERGAPARPRPCVGPFPVPLPRALPPAPAGGGPRPPRYFIYRYISTHAHTRSEGNREDPREKRQNPTATGARRKQNPTGAGRGRPGAQGRGGPGRPGGAWQSPRGFGGPGGACGEGGPGPAAACSLLIFELVGEPVETLVEPVPAGGTGGLDVPVTVAQGVQPQLVRDLRRVHGVGQVLGKRWRGYKGGSRTPP